MIDDGFHTQNANSCATPEAGLLPSGKRKPTLVWLICIACIAGSFLSFAFFLDCYPARNIDEAFFNLPAVRCVEGKSFAFQIHDAAPHGDTVWAYHGPLFFRMQVPLFKLFGVSHTTCRMPGWLGSHLGIFLLCAFLITCGLYWPAVTVAVFWAGDSTLSQLRLGRPEGVAFLFLIIEFIALVKSVTSRGIAWPIVAGCALGIAAGMNLGCSYFFPGCMVAICWLAPKGSVLKVSGGFLAGLAAGLVIFFLCWFPHPVHSFEQFMWFVKFHQKTPDGILLGWQKTMRLFSLGQWWIQALMIVAIVVSVYAVVSKKIRGGGMDSDSTKAILIIACIHGLSAIVIFALSSMQPYYLCFFTVWPMISLMCLMHVRLNPVATRWIVIAVCILGVLWLPGVVRNAALFKHAFTNHRLLDERHMCRILRENIPRGSSIYGDPRYVIVAHKAGYDFEPLPWYRTFSRVVVPAKAWIMACDDYAGDLEKARPDLIAGRPLAVHTNEFDTPNYISPFMVYGPK